MEVLALDVLERGEGGPSDAREVGGRVVATFVNTNGIMACFLDEGKYAADSVCKQLAISFLRG